jgi:hypothetical protein
VAINDSSIELPNDLTALVSYIESAIEDINQAVVAASDLENLEIALWLEWIAEELGDMLLNVMQSSPMEQ